MLYHRATSRSTMSECSTTELHLAPPRVDALPRSYISLHHEWMLYHGATPRSTMSGCSTMVLHLAPPRVDALPRSYISLHHEWMLLPWSYFSLHHEWMLYHGATSRSTTSGCSTTELHLASWPRNGRMALIIRGRKEHKVNIVMMHNTRSIR